MRQVYETPGPLQAVAGARLELVDYEAAEFGTETGSGLLNVAAQQTAGGPTKQ